MEMGGADGSNYMQRRIHSSIVCGMGNCALTRKKVFEGKNDRKSKNGLDRRMRVAENPVRWQLQMSLNKNRQGDTWKRRNKGRQKR